MDLPADSARRRMINVTILINRSLGPPADLRGILKIEGTMACATLPRVQKNINETETETISNSIQHAWNNEQLPHQHRPAGNTDSKILPHP